jgi:hypothetical protein
VWALCAGGAAGGGTLLVVAHQAGVAPTTFRHSKVTDHRTEFSVLRGNQYTPLPGAPSPDGLGSWPVW